MLDVSGTRRVDDAERCFKCPKERRHGDPGWYFVHLDDPRKCLGPSRLFVCPEDYLDFSMSERGRWVPLAGETNGEDGEHRTNGPTSGAEDAAPCTADELITLLALRGLAGWAFLVRDVAAGRVRRIHLRQLPADPEIRRALVSYLQSAGTTLTVSRIFLSNERRFHRA